MVVRQNISFSANHNARAACKRLTGIVVDCNHHDRGRKLCELLKAKLRPGPARNWGRGALPDLRRSRPVLHRHHTGCRRSHWRWCGSSCRMRRYRHTHWLVLSLHSRSRWFCFSFCFPLRSWRKHHPDILMCIIPVFVFHYFIPCARFYKSQLYLQYHSIHILLISRYKVNTNETLRTLPLSFCQKVCYSVFIHESSFRRFFQS